MGHDAEMAREAMANNPGPSVAPVQGTSTWLASYREIIDILLVPHGWVNAVFYLEVMIWMRRAMGSLIALYLIRKIYVERLSTQHGNLDVKMESTLSSNDGTE